jgi:hypothetical protein
MIGFKAIPLVNNKKESHKQNKKMIQVSNSKAYANDSYDQALVHKKFK